VGTGAATIVEMAHMEGATMVTTTESDLTVVKSRTPTIYIPRRFRVGGLPGIRHGAAIVGTPQGEQTVAIDVESTQYVDPTPEIWGTWVAEAARRHSSPTDELPGEEMQSQYVSEHELVAVGRYEDGCVLVNEVGRARLSMWIEAGRTAYLGDGTLVSR
jgi:hypothetical protein